MAFVRAFPSALSTQQLKPESARSKEEGLLDFTNTKNSCVKAKILTQQLDHNLAQYTHLPPLQSLPGVPVSGFHTIFPLPFPL